MACAFAISAFQETRMKTVLFASVAAASLALAGAALAQTLPTPVPANPPAVATPSATPDANVAGQVGATVQAPHTEAGASAQTDAGVAGEAETQAGAEVQAASPESGAQGQAEAETAVSPAQAAANAAAMAASPATPAAEAAAVTTPATAPAMCQPRVTSVRFGARGSALSQENHNAIEYAVDAASVCNLQSVVIADSAEGRISARRAEAVRTALIRQGVPRERITVESRATADAASAGQHDVRMDFAGVASAAAPSASNEAEPPRPPAS
jgi:outer membrane protein OmpA-like peptidoglycan-associated protein